MKRILNIIFLLITICVMVMIFFFSSQDGEESSSTSTRVLDVILSLFIKDYSKLADEEKLVYIDMYSYIIRKAAHFTEFALLGFFSFSFLSTLERRIGNKKRFLISFIYGVFYASFDEAHQLFTPSRSGSIKDVLIDSSGVFTGVTIAILIFYFLEKRKETR